MLALFGTIFVTSLVGSPHCAGMCGPFVAFAVGTGRGRSTTLHAAYNLGRLATYALLGAISGLLGQALNLGGAQVGIPQAAAVVAGAMMVTFGVVLLLRSLGVRLPEAPLPGFVRAIVMRSHRAALAMTPVRRATVIGLCSALLPCGWLYAFVITAAGTASALWGALVMVAFWLGTVPILLSLGVSVRALLGTVGKRLPVVSAIAIVVVGMATLFHRVAIPASAFDTIRESAPETVQGTAPTAPTIAADELPCCKHDGP